MNTTPDKIEIVITDQRFGWRSLKVLSAIAVFIVLPVSIGIYFDSSPMQWFGFLFTMLYILIFALRERKGTTFTSVRSAKAYLDTLPGDGNIKDIN